MSDTERSERHDGEPPSAPPTDYAYSETEPAQSSRESRWPKVIGVLSLIYALLGMLCAFSTVGSPWLTEWLTRLGGVPMEFPVWLKITAVISGLLNVILGFIMFFGAINLLRRRRSGVSMLKFWAVSRIALIVLGFGLNVIMAPQNIEFQRQVVELQNERVRDGGRPDLVQEFSDEELWQRTLRNSAIFSGLIAIYPVFIGFYLSRRKIEDEMDEWVEFQDV